MKKKILSFIIMICLIIPCVFSLASCGKSKDDASAKVLNVELNPKLEFVLDKDNKVLSVNALDDDGNQIVSASVDDATEVSEFIGLTADEAVEMFLELSEENGYLITGDEDKIRIEISGKADNLMKKVKQKANKFFKDNGFDVEIVTEKLEKEDIIKEVKGCLKEYSEEELKAMTQEELIELLKNSRKETSNLLTQELKDAYYNMRLDKLNLAELERIYKILTTEPVASLVSQNVEIQEFLTSIGSLKTKLTELQTAYETYYLKADSDDLNLNYFEAKEAYVIAKENLLNKRLELVEGGLTETEKTELASLQNKVKEAEDKIEAAKETADTEINRIRTELNSLVSSAKQKFEQLKTTISSIAGIDLSVLDNVKQLMKESFKNHFGEELNFSEYIGHDKGHWGKDRGQPA